MDDRRPDPDRLLRELREESPRGKLKLFFGYAAGVGKTYAMLEAAHAAKDAGVDVTAGYIEPHTRPETMALLEGLEQLPPLKVAYRNITLNEFDLDAALKRRPQLILVDELAHTNAEGCRHKKRCQDIEELLTAGIDVYTTVNVQHIESLNDLVASITGVVVRERLPDSVFDGADQVELVDIEPADLIARLQKGKVYREGQAARALDNFFVPENLAALREIALRRTADRVNRGKEKKSGADGGQYFTGEHILVCLSSSPSNAKVIRAGGRMAEAFHGRFTALFVETPNTTELTEENRGRLRENLRLAEQMGAKIATVYGEDVPEQIAQYAEVSGVSKIILGRSNNKKSMLRRGKSLVEKLTAEAPNLDIYIIPDNLPPYKKPVAMPWPAPFSATDAAKAAGILALCTLVGYLFVWWGFSDTNIITTYILGVLLISLWTSGRIYSGVASILSVLLFNFCFTSPFYTLQFDNKSYFVTFVVTFLAGILTSSLAIRIKRQARLEAMKSHRTEVLLETSQKLQRSQSGEEICSAAAEQIVRLLDRSVTVYRAENGALDAPVFFPRGEGETGAPYLAADEGAVAQWAYKNHKHAGATTDTLPGAKCLYMAVRNNSEVFAVVGIAMDGDSLEAYEKNLLVALLGEFALALEMEALDADKKQVEVRAQQEQLRANLLRAISHDLRTPLTSISGNANILMGNAAVLSEEQRERLYTDIYDDSMWLINLVENLLAVTRIENDAMNIHREPELWSEVVAEAMAHIDRRKTEHVLAVRIEDELLMTCMDSRLIVQVIINLVDNAIKYTPAGSHINLTACRRGDEVEVAVADDGPGVPDEAKEKLFDMFFTAGNTRGDGRRSLGLGLSLCKSIVEAHGGTIGVRNNDPRGAIVWFRLKAEEVTVDE
ncbi:MAG: sensor histidine kinase KdpD [Clostridia bacterium]|nr:sensor histidine kinase KdpD [Clostridia bacterium]